MFKITSGGAITRIMDATGDGQGHGFSNPSRVALDGDGNAYVNSAGTGSVFQIATGGTITQIISTTGDGVGNVYVTGSQSNSAFKIASSP